MTIAGLNTCGLLERREEYVPVADAAHLRRPQNGLDRSVNPFGFDGELNLNLGKQRNLVAGHMAYLAMATLTIEAASPRYRRALCCGFLRHRHHPVELAWLDYGREVFQEWVPRPIGSLRRLTIHCMSRATMRAISILQPGAF